MDNVEQDFYSAIKRLQLGQPTNSALKSKQSANKLIKLTIANIALEAGRSRTLIGFQGCAYPKLRAYILNLIKQGSEAAPHNQQEVNRRIREKNAALATQLTLARSEQANLLAHFIKLEIKVAMLSKGRSTSTKPSQDQRRKPGEKVVRIYPSPEDE
ncbi:hypothetical protein [Pseudomonas costantinii]|uniref:hypothetical protein n=1 Tax=Pseudomonas costantinii TaxID=168469 RepID=UPI0015A16447|nr:hypothetical protein [Pseudomonas costantinii]NVZ69082.1 hypothetical protein [Pseudomonas costantinii]